MGIKLKKTKDQLWAQIVSLMWKIEDQKDWSNIQGYIRLTALHRSGGNNFSYINRNKVYAKIRKLYDKYEEFEVY